MMVENQTDAGFSVVELIVTLVIVAAFLTLFFQLFLTGQSQQLAVERRAAANSIAESNLQKINTRASIPVTTRSCADSAGAESTIADDDATSDPKWVGDTGGSNSGLTKESTTATALPGSGVIQKLSVQYPHGCAPNMPAKIISTVRYGTTESVVHASYVN